MVSVILVNVTAMPVGKLKTINNSVVKKLVAKTTVVVMVNVMIQNVFVLLDGQDLNVKNMPHAPTNVAVMAFAF
jgi:hypothetical protein